MSKKKKLAPKNRKNRFDDYDDDEFVRRYERLEDEDLDDDYEDDDYDEFEYDEGEFDDEDEFES